MRRGGRTNLIATIDVPDLPGDQVTIVAAHLENRTTPKGRVKQMDEILDIIKPISHPVVVAGDMNTTGADGSVVSIKSAILRKMNDPSFWATKGVKYATGVGFGMDIAGLAFKTTKFQSDPTASGVPLLAANPEQGLFKELNKFRFDDQTRLDYRGDAELSVLGRQGTLGNSNERGSKGFMTTFALPRTLGVVGKFRLDWIFVKAYLKDDPKSADSYRFAPHFARTMNEANQAFARSSVRPCCHQCRSADHRVGRAKRKEVGRVCASIPAHDFAVLSRYLSSASGPPGTGYLLLPCHGDRG